MTDYWKSTPKHYCKFCNIWIADNKSSRDFHEKGLKHQHNVQQKIRDAQRESSNAEREAKQYAAEMRKIEAAALSSFQGDIARNSSYAKEIPASSLSSSSVSQSKSSDSQPSPQDISKPIGSRFGESASSSSSKGDNEKESSKLARGRTDALEVISKVMEKKSKWLETVTADGDIYYYNKDTYETTREPPKNYLSLGEQGIPGYVKAPPKKTSSSEKVQVFPARFSSQWQTVPNASELEEVDLQLPGDKRKTADKEEDVEEYEGDLKSVFLGDDRLPEPAAVSRHVEVSETDEMQQLVESGEKTVENCKRKITSSKDNVSFKKRSNATKRSIRIKDDDD